MCNDYFQKHSLGGRTIDRATVAVTGTISTCYRATGLCPSVTSRCPIETAKRIKLVFGMGASFDLDYTVINTKNCSLSIVLTATDQKPQKSLKR